MIMKNIYSDPEKSVKEAYATDLAEKEIEER